MTNCIMKPKTVLPIRVIFHDKKTGSVLGIYYFEDLAEIAETVDLERVCLVVNKVDKGCEYILPQDNASPGDVYPMSYVSEGSNRASKAFFIIDSTVAQHDYHICDDESHDHNDQYKILWFKAIINVIDNNDNPRDSISMQIFSLNDYGQIQFQVASIMAKVNKYKLDPIDFENFEQMLDKYILQFASSFNPGSIFKMKEEDANNHKIEDDDDGEFL